MTENYEQEIFRINDMLAQSPDDFGLLLEKILILQKNKSYVEALKLCDKTIRLHPDKTKTLNDIRKNIYDEYPYPRCKKLRTPKIDCVSAILDFLTKYWAVIVLCIFLFVIVKLPTKEIMTCNSDYSCKIEHEFISFIKIHDTMNLSKNSIILDSFKYHRPHRVEHFYYRASYHLRINFDSKDPFIMEQSYFDSQDDAIEYYCNIERDFYNYLKNPTQGFTLSSQADPIICYGILIILAIGFFFPRLNKEIKMKDILKKFKCL